MSKSMIWTVVVWMGKYPNGISSSMKVLVNLVRQRIGFEEKQSVKGTGRLFDLDARLFLVLNHILSSTLLP